MVKKEYPVDVYFECPVCPECGGDIRERAGDMEYMSNPPQADFKCSKCGNIVRLAGPDYPRVKYRIGTQPISSN